MVPPITNLKTYSRRTNSSVFQQSRSVNVLNNLFAENLQKRKQTQKLKKRKFEIKELPPQDVHHGLLKDSFEVPKTSDDLFDKVVNLPDYNKVRVVPISTAKEELTSTNSISDSSSSLSNIRKKIFKEHLSDDCPKQMSRKMTNLSNSTDHSYAKDTNKSNFNQKSLEKSVTESLLIEKGANKSKYKNITTLGSLSDISSSKSNASKLIETRQIKDKIKTNYDSLFKDRNTLLAASTPMAHCSTPLQATPTVLHSPVSPICELTSNLLMESYQEIKSWSTKEPDFNTTPLNRRSGKIRRNRFTNSNVRSSRNKLQATVTSVCPYTPDWKLKVQPKVVLEDYVNILGISSSITFEQTVLHGFSTSVVAKSKKKDIILKDLLKCRNPSTFLSVPKPNPTTPPRKITNKNDSSLNASKKLFTESQTPVNIGTPRKTRCKKSDSSLNTNNELFTEPINVSTPRNLRSKKSDSSLDRSSELFSEPNAPVSVRTLRTTRSKKSDSSLDRSSELFSEPNAPVSVRTLRKTRRKKTDSSLTASNEVFTEPKIPTTKHLKIVLEKFQLFNQIKSKAEEASGKDVEKSNEILARDEEIANEQESTINNDEMFLSNYYGVNSVNYNNSNEIIKKETFNNILGSPTNSICDDVFDITNTNYQNSEENCTEVILPEGYDNFTSSDEESMEDFSRLLADSDEENATSFSSELNINKSIPVLNEVTNELNRSDKQIFDENSLVITKVVGNAESESDEDLLDSSNIYANPESRYSGNDLEFVNVSTINSTREDYLHVTADCNSIINIIDETANMSTNNANYESVISLSSSSEDEQEQQCNEITSSTMINSPILQEDITRTSCNSTVMNQTSSSNAGIIEIYSSDEELLDSVMQKSNDGSSSLPSDNFLMPFAMSFNNSNLQQSTSNDFCLPKKRITLKPGKKWRRSLFSMRASTVKPNDLSCISSCRKSNRSRNSTQIIPTSPLHKIKEKVNLSVLESYASTKLLSDKKEKSGVCDFIDEPKTAPKPIIVTAKEIVLRRCGQIEPLPFAECYPSTILQNCFKVGEGVYGEVFLYRNPDSTVSVMKVIPIEGQKIVNGERQKKFEEIISEIVIAGELSNLRNGCSNQTNTFSEVKRIRCVKGLYPSRLIELWELYDEAHGSENDSPDMFDLHQLYIVLELANGGSDMESYNFNNSYQALSIFKQTACALAVAEVALQFEHRDLHWGNILVLPTDKQQTLNYSIDGVDIGVKSFGVKASIIDFTLSRMTFEDVCIYNNLGGDPELFEAHGDYQFDVYRLMQKHNQNEWQHFDPYTNILWLHYILDKMIHMLRYKYKKTKVHEEGILKLNQMKDVVLNYNSAVDFVRGIFINVI